MKTVTSRDGTRIAFEKQGHGPAVILVGGALSTRTIGPTELASLLAPKFTTYIHDRRGRGDSGNTTPYAVRREVEDIEAMIDDAGGTASIYGHSSGGALALEASIALGGKVTNLAMYDAPYTADATGQLAFEAYGKRLAQLLAAGRRTSLAHRADAVALFLTVVGMPPDQIGGGRDSPIWSAFLAAAPTLAYDYMVVGEGSAVPTKRAAGVTVPALIMSGGESPPFMRATAKALSQAIPRGELRIVAGQGHDVSQKVLAPVLGEFFAAG